MTRILAGTITRTDPETLRAHLETMRAQCVSNVRVDLVYIDDNLDPESSEVLADHAHTILKPGARNAGAEYAVSAETHHWSVPTFHFLAREKQRLLDMALAEGYDYVFLVDSDLLLAPDTLSSLLACEKPITSACFWTKWTPSDPELPQVWNRHPYGFDGAGWNQSDFLRALRDRELVRVRGLGACTLIAREALEKGVGFWPLLSDLPSDGMWQGEDRHFCLKAERLHVEMWCDAFPRVLHLYRPESMREEQAKFLASNMRAEGAPIAGDWLSFTVEPCEEPALALHREHVRGRLGLLRVLPEIEFALFSMKVGESRIIRAKFPPDWPIPQYQNSSRTLRLKLLATHTP